MRPRALLILFALVAGLGSFIWFVDRDLPGSDERAEEAKKLLRLDNEEITRIELETARGRFVFARQDGDGWDLLEPLAARADDSKVNGLLSQLAALQKERTFTDGSSAELGLEPPTATLVLSGPAGEERLLVGGLVPASDSMIVASAQQGPFHVVAKIDASELQRTASDWRSRKIFPASREDIVRLTLARGADKMTLARRGEDYYLESPLEDRADEGTVSRFVDALVGLEAVEFVDPAASSDEHFDGEDGERVLEVETADGDEPWRLTLGRDAGPGAEGEEALIYLRAEDHDYVAPDRLSEAFERPPEEWRSLEWATRQVFEIDRLEVRDAVGTLELERVGGDWLRDGVKIEYGPVSDLLYAIVGTKGEALGADEAVTGAPLITVTLNPGDDSQVLEVYAATGDSHPATVNGRAAALWLGGDSVRSLVSHLAEVRAAAAVEAAAGDGTGVDGGADGGSTEDGSPPPPAAPGC